MKFQPPGSNIHIIARVLLTQGEDVIFCRPKNAEWFFLPGGHVEDNESAKEALLRELSEEVGISVNSDAHFIGICENVFLLDEDNFQHEINIVFNIALSIDLAISTKEAHIEFVSVPIKELKDYKIMPTHLKSAILEWFDTKAPFFKGIEK